MEQNQVVLDIADEPVLTNQQKYRKINIHRFLFPISIQ